MLTLGLLLTGCVSGPRQSAKPVDDAVRRVTAPQGRYFGVSTRQAPWSRAETDAVARKAGSAPNLLEYFVKWTEDFRPAAVRASYAQGAVPLLTWEPWAGSGAGTRQPRYALARIAEGGYDAYVTRFAKAVRAQGRPVVIRFAHEMNGTWFPWSEQRNGNHRGDYVKAWRHVHDLFERVGADNVVWLWSPNVVRDAPAVSLRELYPGDAYVDLVGMTGYQDDESTDEPTYRANLETLVAGVRARGGDPVLVTPIVRRWFNADGTLNNDTALLVNGLGVDHPAVIRSVAAAEHVPLIDLTAKTKALVESLGVEGSKAIYLYNEKRDNTHTSVHGATVYAGLVRDELLAQHLVPGRQVRVG